MKMKKSRTTRKFIREAKELDKSLCSLENGNILRLKEQSNYIQLLDEKVKSLLQGGSDVFSKYFYSITRKEVDDVFMG